MKIMQKLTALMATMLMVFFSFSALAETGVTDAGITAAIKSKIELDKTLSNTRVNVSTNNGVVVLSGTVKTDSEASALIEIAQSVPGVIDIDTSRLKIAGSKQPFTDTAITAKVKGLFIREKLFGDKDISAMTIGVETNNGMVTLTGTADSQEEIENAINLAKSIKGVKRVESRVTVAP